MNKLDVRAAPREIGSIFDWLLANLDRLAIGALVAAVIVLVMLDLSWVGRRWAATDPELDEALKSAGIVGRD